MFSLERLRLKRKGNEMWLKYETTSQQCNRPKVIIRSQITPCFLALITASTDLDLIN